MSATIRTGSILFVRRKSRLSRLIAWFTRGHGEEPTLATHVDLFLMPGIICGINGDKRRPYVRPWENLRDELDREKAEWAIMNPRLIWTEGQERRLRGLVRRLREEARYSYAELILQAVDGILARLLRKRQVVLARKLGGLWEKGLICSGFATFCYCRIRGELCDLSYSDPDTLLDTVSQADSWFEDGPASPGFWEG